MNTATIDYSSYPFKAIILLGLALKKDGSPKEEMVLRAKKAAELYQKKMAPVIVACGADSTHTGIVEADVLRDLLVEKYNVPAEAILRDGESHVTYENILNAKAMLPKDKKLVALVTSEYHNRRGLMLCKKYGLPAKGFPTEVPNKEILKARNKLERFYRMEIYIGWERTTPRRPAWLANIYHRFLRPYQEKVNILEGSNPR